MEQHGWIQSVGIPQNNRRARYYELTRDEDNSRLNRLTGTAVTAIGKIMQTA
jgi:hypothetical protein